MKACLLVLLAACAHAVPATESCHDLPSCEAHCLHGDGPSCSSAAAHMRDQPADATPARYAAVLDRACAARDARSCNRLGQLLGDAPELAPDSHASKRAYARGCALGDEICCVAGLDNLEDAVTQLTELRPRAEQRCDAGNGRSCSFLSMLALLGHDANVRATLDVKAARAFERSCAAGNADDCVSGALLLATIQVAAKRTRLLAMYRRGCELGDGEACGLLADAPESRLDERATVRQRACDHGQIAACLAIATDAAHAHAAGAAQLLSRAIANARGGCALGDEHACIAVAKLVGSDVVSDADASRLATIAERACDRREVLTCVKLAEVLLEGPVARRDEARAEALRERACVLGYPFTCPVR